MLIADKENVFHEQIFNCVKDNKWKVIIVVDDSRVTVSIISKILEKNGGLISKDQKSPSQACLGQEKRGSLVKML